MRDKVRVLMNEFDRSDHVYTSPDFAEIIKDTIRFFNGTPVHRLPPPVKFHGTGVYAIYCIAKSGIYSKYNKVNRTSFQMPIYVGKAVPSGWRQARVIQRIGSESYEIHSRLREHWRSIDQGAELNEDDFYCRFMILEGKESDLISTVEAALIRKYRPLWNTVVDGFGNHDPGRGRYNQAKSDWDVCHPGRKWADRCEGIPSDRQVILDNIRDFLTSLKDDE